MSTLTLTPRQKKNAEFVQRQREEHAAEVPDHALDGEAIARLTVRQRELARENIARLKAYKAQKNKPAIDVSVGTILHLSKPAPLTAPVRSLLDQ
jgi:hypothetical protein